LIDEVAILRGRIKQLLDDNAVLRQAAVGQCPLCAARRAKSRVANRRQAERRRAILAALVKRGRPVEASLIEQTKALRLAGWGQMEIAVELRLAQGTVSKILREAGLGGWREKRGLACDRISCSPEQA
jgi:hypothetical protein